MSQPPTGPLLCVVGPTATGKSDVALAVAGAVGGEIVNADASQLYRDMDIGTAKLAPPQRRGVPHHLIDVLEVEQEASVEAYQRAARASIAEIGRRGRLPVLVGGSGLYVSAVLDPLVFPGTDPDVRARLEAELADRGAAALHARLAARDPAAATAILPGNGRRIVRALEVGEVTGLPFTATLPPVGDRPWAIRVVVLDADPTELDDRIAARVEAMWDAGLVAEVTALAPRLQTGRTARRALGYAQLLRHLAGDIDEATAHAETVRATRRFARRQRSWFRRETGSVRLTVAGDPARNGPAGGSPATVGPVPDAAIIERVAGIAEELAAALAAAGDGAGRW